MRTSILHTVRLLLGIPALLSGLYLLLTLNDLPWRISLTLHPLYRNGPLEAAMGCMAVVSAVAAIFQARAWMRGGASWRTALAAGTCLWLFLWSVFPMDACQVPQFFLLVQSLAAFTLTACGVHWITLGRSGGVILALWSLLLRPRDGLFLFCTAGGAAVAAFLLSHCLFRAAPVISDGNCYLYLAHLLAEGRVTGPVPVPADLEFMVSLPFIGGDNAWFIQHPPGYPALLAMGVVLGVPHAVNAILTGVLVWGLHGLGRAIHGRAVGRGAALLGAASPLSCMYGAMFMAHTAAMAALVGFAWAMIQCRRRGWKAPVVAGLLLGAAAVIRPYSALLVAIPFLISGAVRFVRRPRWHAWRAGLLGLGLLPLLITFCLYNKATTGSMWTLGYQVFHGAGHNIGFGMRGFAHDLESFTPWMGFAHTQYRIGYIQQYFLLWPVPLFLLILAAFRGRSGRLERILLAAFVCLALGYGCYFNRGDRVCDPRFLLEACPGLLVVAVLAVRRAPLHSAFRGTAVAVAVLISVVIRFPVEAHHMRATMMKLRDRVDPAVEAVEKKRGILFLDRDLYRVAPGLVWDPMGRGPLLRAKASGRADDRFRALFPHRPAAFYLAEDAGGFTVYEEIEQLEDLSRRPHRGGLRRTHVEGGEMNRILVLGAGESLRFPVKAGEDQALVWGHYYRGPPEGGVLVVRVNGGESIRVPCGRPEWWRFRNGFLALPCGKVNVEFMLEGRGRVGIVNPDRIRARIVTRYSL